MLIITFVLWLPAAKTISTRMSKTPSTITAISKSPDSGPLATLPQQLVPERVVVDGGGPVLVSIK